MRVKLRDVSIIGAYETKFGVLENKSFRDLIMEAGNRAIRDAGIERKAIQAVYVGNFAAPDFVDQNQVASFAATTLGFGHLPAIRFETACSSSGIALREANFAVGMGLYDFVLVMGVEKMNTKETAETMAIIARGGDQELSASVGTSGPASFALTIRRHMYEFGTTKEQLAAVALKNYTNGFKNPIAHLRKQVDMKMYMNAVMIADPYCIHDCSLVTDGAAALVICPRDIAKNFNSRPIDIIGTGIGGSAFSFFLKPSIIEFDSTKLAAEEAYQMAGIDPKDIDVCEVHDCFTGTEIINIEDLGFCNKGDGGPFIEDGKAGINGEVSVNASGGLKSKGHPIGATGAAQVVEITKQLRGLAEEGRQVKDPEIGLTHAMGGPASLASVFILSKGY